MTDCSIQLEKILQAYIRLATRLISSMRRPEQLKVTDEFFTLVPKTKQQQRTALEFAFLKVLVRAGLRSCQRRTPIAQFPFG